MAKPKPLNDLQATSVTVEKEILARFNLLGLNRSEFIRKCMIKEVERHDKLNNLSKRSQED